MEFLDPAKRKKKQRQLFLGYGLLTILVFLATYVLAATAVGYEIFNTSGTLVQNGLVFVASEPVPATILVDGKAEDEKTESRLPLPSGQYTITLNEPGYTSWTKKVSVNGGDVQFISYPRLFPTQLNPVKQKELPGATGLTTQSPDQRWLVVQQSVASPILTVFDLSKDTPESVSLTIPSAILGGQPGAYGSLVLIEWADNNRHFLVRQNLPDGTYKFLLIDRQEIGESLDLNASLSAGGAESPIAPTKLTLRDKKFDRYYLLFSEGGILRSGELRSTTLSEPIVDQVLAYQTSGSGLIAYATTRDAVAGKVAIKIHEGSSETLVGEVVFDPASNYYLTIARYNGSWFYALGTGQSDRISIYRNPRNFSDNAKKPPVTAIAKAGANLTQLETSPKKRFLLARSGSKFAVYDNRENKVYNFDAPIKLDQSSTVSWMDEFHIQVVSGGKVGVFEFDGANARTLTTVRGVIPGYFSRDLETLFTIGPSGDSQALYRTMLRLTGN